MKFKKIIFPLIAALTLVGCNEKKSSENLSSNEPATSIIDSSNNSSSSSDIEVDPLANGSVGGSLIEIGVGEELLVNSTFNCVFVPSDCENKALRAVYDEDLITLTFQENVDGHFSIKTKDKAGSCVLKLYSVELDCLVYRNKITVSKMVDDEKIEDFLFNSDIWKTRPETISIAGKYDLSFISNAPLTAVLKGSDYEEETRATLELTYKSMRRNNEFLFYVFDTTLDSESSSTNRKFKEILVSVTGYSIYVYDNQGLLNIFYQL